MAFQELVVPEPLNHLHLLVRAEVNKPATTPLSIETWLTELVAAVGMKVLIPARAVVCDEPGNEGVTGIICLETSHASIHIWDSGYLQFDLYSCRHFDVNAVLERFRLFDPRAVSYQLIDRNELAQRTIESSTLFYTIDQGDIEGTQETVRRALKATGPVEPQSVRGNIAP